MTAPACALCQNMGPLLQSHLIPKFVAKYLKRTSPTKKFRSSGQPNRTVQDLETRPLLCASCEQLFSGWEAKFAPAFRAHAENGDDGFDYDDWLLRFAVSLSWRTVVTQINDDGLAPEAKRRVRESAEKWRQFLLNDAPLPSGEGHHVILTPLIMRLVGAGQPYLVSYPVRATDSQVWELKVQVGDAPPIRPMIVYTKLPNFAFLTFLEEPGDLIEGTRLLNKGRLDLGQQRIRAPYFERCLSACLRSRVEHLAQVSQQISPRQLQRNAAAIKADLESGSPSAATQAFLWDRRVGPGPPPGPQAGGPAEPVEGGPK